MRNIWPGISEKAVSDLFSSVWESYSARVAYDNIVCCGANGSFLHYEANESIIFGPTDLILIDSAVKHRGYCSDITRTYPVSGKFTIK